MKTFTIENEKLRAVFIDYGARLISLTVKDKEIDVIYGCKNPDDMLSDKSANFGACVGRYANRIAHARFTLGGKEYLLPANDGENCLHGGRGFANRYYDCKDENNTLVCTYDSPDGEDGFPGNLRLTVTYSLQGGALKIEYRAVCDKETVCNFTNHSYFNLNGGGNVLSHTLFVDADRINPTDSQSIPLKETMDVTGTPFDFREPKQVGRDIGALHEQLILARGYDHNYILNGSGFRKCARLSGDESGITMDVYTDQPGIQIYSGNYLVDADECYRGAICLETQHFPDTPNRPDFPSCILMPSEEMISVTMYEFS